MNKTHQDNIRHLWKKKLGSQPLTREKALAIMEDKDIKGYIDKNGLTDSVNFHQYFSKKGNNRNRMLFKKNFVYFTLLTYLTGKNVEQLAQPAPSVVSKQISNVEVTLSNFFFLFVCLFFVFVELDPS